MVLVVSQEALNVVQLRVVVPQVTGDDVGNHDQRHLGAPGGRDRCRKLVVVCLGEGIHEFWDSAPEFGGCAFSRRAAVRRGRY